MRLRSAVCLLAFSLAACTEEPAPTSPRQALFTINPGSGDRGFALVSLTAINAQHEASASFTAPYAFYMENAVPPVEGIFQPMTDASVSDVQLLLGGETVPRVVSNPRENSQFCNVPTPAPGMPGTLCVNSGAAPVPSGPATVEVRFDVVSTPPGIFSASVGGINLNYLVSNGQTPASVYVEEVQELAQGVFSKADVGASLTVTLLVDGVARTTETSGPGDTANVVVQYQFD